MPQQTLTGDKADTDIAGVVRSRPETFIWCEECDEYILRSKRFDHPHDFDTGPSAFRIVSAGDDDEVEVEEEPEPEPERVGSWHDVTLSYSVDYRFRIPAYSEHEAKDRAADLKLDAYPADSYQVHDRIREVKEIMSDDDELPDDWDPYGGEPLWDVFNG